MGRSLRARCDGRTFWCAATSRRWRSLRIADHRAFSVPYFLRHLRHAVVLPQRGTKRSSPSGQAGQIDHATVNLWSYSRMTGSRTACTLSGSRAHPLGLCSLTHEWKKYGRRSAFWAPSCSRNQRRASSSSGCQTPRATHPLAAQRGSRVQAKVPRFIAVCTSRSTAWGREPSLTRLFVLDSQPRTTPT